MATDKDVQESWYQVENTEGIQTVRSTEEIAELLADAVTEKVTNEIDDTEEDVPLVMSTSVIPVPTSSELVSSDMDELKNIEDLDEDTLTFNVSHEYVDPQYKYQSPYHNTIPSNREKTGYLNGIIYYIKDFLKSLLNPAIVVSHMAVFGLGIFIGRRLSS